MTTDISNPTICDELISNNEIANKLPQHSLTHLNDLKIKRADFTMPSFSPIRTNSMTDTPSMDFRETTKKLDFGEILGTHHNECSEYKVVDHYADEEDEHIVIDLA